MAVTRGHFVGGSGRGRSVLSLQGLRKPDTHCVGSRSGQLLAGSEAGVELTDQLQAALGFRGNVLDLSVARRDKWLMGER